MATARTTPTTLQLHDMLRARYAAPEWVLVEELRNGTGYSRGRQAYADAVAFNCYPSRGLAVHGFEVKASRSDWVRELERPDRAEAWARWCDAWWLVVACPSIVRPGELPAGWGLLVPAKEKLKVAVEPAARKGEPFDRAMVAAVLRHVTDRYTPKASIQGQLVEQYRKGEAAGKADAERASTRLREAVADFAEASGVNLLQASSWDVGNIGKAVAVVRAARQGTAYLRPSADVARLTESIRRKLDGLEALRAELAALEAAAAEAGLADPVPAGG